MTHQLITDRAVIRASDEPDLRPASQHVGDGTNAEDCPGCRALPDGEYPDYPWVCPGEEAA